MKENNATCSQDFVEERHLGLFGIVPDLDRAEPGLLRRPPQE